MTVYSQPTVSAVEPPRDYLGRPMIEPPGGGKAVAYTRCTTFVKALDDTTNLELWGKRMVALGLARRPDLLAIVQAHGVDDKKALNAVCKQALEAAAAASKANDGTARHKFSERLDAGEITLDDVPAGELREDLRAYVNATSRLHNVAAETFVVVDDLKIGGTFDRLVEVPLGSGFPAWLQGKRVILDLKTGASLDYSIGSIAMQLAVYAHGERYDAETKERRDLGADQGVALVCHAPANTATAQLYAVDIGAGWAAVQLASTVRAWRRDAKLSALAAPV
jgi:hypothetical protein